MRKPDIEAKTLAQEKRGKGDANMNCKLNTCIDARMIAASITTDISYVQNKHSLSLSLSLFLSRVYVYARVDAPALIRSGDKGRRVTRSTRSGEMVEVTKSAATFSRTTNVSRTPASFPNSVLLALHERDDRGERERERERERVRGGEGEEGDLRVRRPRNVI